MGEFCCELKPLGVVAAVVSIVWLTAMSDVEPRPEHPVLLDTYAERMLEAGGDFEASNERWGLVRVEVEAE